MRCRLVPVLVVALAASLLPLGTAAGTAAAAAPGTSVAARHEAFADAAAATDWARLPQAPDAAGLLAAGDDDHVRRLLRAQAGAPLEPQRSESRTNQWYDECDDAVGGIDLRSLFMVQTTDDAGRDDQSGFLAYACQPWVPADLPLDGILIALYARTYPAGLSCRTTRPGPDFVVRFFAEGERLRIQVVRTPTDTDQQAYTTWLADAQRLDSHAVDGVVPTAALGGICGETGSAVPPENLPPTDGGFEGDHEFEVYVAVPAAAAPDGIGDRMAELYDRVPMLYPNDCTQLIGQSDFTRQAVVPNDPLFPQQWALTAVNAPAAWARRSSSGVRVAVVDDGVDGLREEFSGRVVAGHDLYNDVALAQGHNSDRGGHGTAVAGVLGASGNNGREIAGVDWGAQIIPLRVGDVNGCIYDDVVAAAIDRAVAEDARVINLSLGAPDDFPLVRRAVDLALSSGVVVVASSGNFGLDGDPTVFPAAYPGVIGVGASTRSGERADYSSTGRHLMLVAPGGSAQGDAATQDVLVLAELDRVRPVAGTSFSAPMVSGAVALFLGLLLDATVDDVRLALQRSAADLGPPGQDSTTGYGLLNIDALLQQVPSAPPNDPALNLVRRVGAADAVASARGISQVRFADGTAAHAVLARGDVFADALAGAALTDRGPLLFSAATSIDQETMDELHRTVGDGGTVYLLGGTGALGFEVAQQLSSAGFVVRRLAGDSRVETAVAVASEVRRLHPDGTTVALARSDSGAGEPTAAWADSVTGGAWAASAGVPLLVTARDALHPAVAAFLDEVGPSETVLLGGTAALSEAVAQAVPAPRRVQGPDRAATATAVATQLWDVTAMAGYLVSNGYASDGWAHGLAAAGLAADAGTPLVLVDHDGVPSATAALVEGTCDGADPRLTLVGAAQQIGGSAESALVEAAGC